MGCFKKTAQPSTERAQHAAARVGLLQPRVEARVQQVDVDHVGQAAEARRQLRHVRLAQVDDLEREAALDLGATPARVFLRITLPLIAPALIAGWLLAFTLSLDDLVIASFATGPGATTLPMRIYSQVRLGVTPEINAISSLMIALVAGALVLAGLLQRRTKS